MALQGAFLGALAWVHPAWAEPVVQSWDARDGLLQHSVTAIAQTSDGYLWLGTGAGLYRFDGVRFERWVKADHAGLAGDRILSLLVDGENVLHVGTTSGLSHILGDRSERDQAGCDVVWQRMDPYGQVWSVCRSDGGGLAGPPGPALDALNGAVDDIFDLAFAEGGDIWALDGVGRVFRWSASEGRVSDLVALYNASLLRASDRGDLLLIGGHSGLFTWRDGVLRHETRQPVTWLGPEHPEGHLVGLGDGTLARFRWGQGLEPVLTLPSTVQVTYEPQGGPLWVGTRAHGLFRLAPRRVHGFQAGVVPEEQSVSAVFQDSLGGLWTSVPCSGGRRFRVENDALVPDRAAGTGCVWSFGEYPTGTVWLGTWGAGVFRHDLARGQDLEGPEGLPATVLALLPSREGGIWVGGWEGLMLWREEGLEVPPALQGLGPVIHLREDEEGGTWIGTEERLFRWDGENLQAFGPPEGLPEAPVRDTVSLPQPEGPQSMLVATYGAGLYRFDGERFEPFSQGLGLQDLFLSRIVLDEGGAWLTGNSGVYRLPLDPAGQVLEAGVPPSGPIALGLADGLPATECNGGNTSAGFLDGRGHLVVPTLQGVALVETRAVGWEPREAPRVRVESVSVGGAVVEPPIQLPPSQREVEVRYTAFHDPAPELLRFRYRLDQGTWWEAGARRVAVFSGLGPGPHHVEVQARVADGPWSDPARVDFQATPAWHERWIARLGLVPVCFLLAAVVWLVMRRRQQSIRRLVEDRTRELAEANEKLEALAHVDSLTGVATRRCFEDRLAMYWSGAFRSNEPLSLLMIDMDHFKSLNDQHGHPMGDRCLVELAACMGAIFQRDLDLVARFGGDEFVVLLPDTGPQGALSLAHRLHADVGAIRLPQVPTLRLTLSVGVATAWPRHGGSPPDLLSAADRALYEAKARGRDRVVPWTGAAHGWSDGARAAGLDPA